MSRIGKKPIEIPSGVEATLKERTIEVKGALGSRHFDFSEKLNVDIADNRISVTPKNLEKETRQLWGMSRSQISNIVTGVNAGFSKELETSPEGKYTSLTGHHAFYRLIFLPVPREAPTPLPLPSSVGVCYGKIIAVG